MSNIRKLAAKGLVRGDQFVLRRTFTEEETHLFGDLTQDYNPVHYDQGWARLKKFPDLICHGLLIGAMICEFGGQVGWLAAGMNFRFEKPVYFNQEITLTVTLEKLNEDGNAVADGIFTNPENEKVASVKLYGRLPVNAEKAYLNQMVKQGDKTNKRKRDIDIIHQLNG